MMTGEVKGIMLNQKAIWLFGSCMALTMTTMASMRGTVMGSPQVLGILLVVHGAAYRGEHGCVKEVSADEINDEAYDGREDVAHVRQAAEYRHLVGADVAHGGRHPCGSRIHGGRGGHRIPPRNSLLPRLPRLR